VPAIKASMSIGSHPIQTPHANCILASFSYARKRRQESAFHCGVTMHQRYTQVVAGRKACTTRPGTQWFDAPSLSHMVRHSIGGVPVENSVVLTRFVALVTMQRSIGVCRILIETWNCGGESGELGVWRW
jgi:hypothetical protein